jgi:hypothetical protein
MQKQLDRDGSDGLVLRGKKHRDCPRVFVSDRRPKFTAKARSSPSLRTSQEAPGADQPNLNRKKAGTVPGFCLKTALRAVGPLTPPAPSPPPKPGGEGGPSSYGVCCLAKITKTRGLSPRFLSVSDSRWAARLNRCGDYSHRPRLAPKRLTGLEVALFACFGVSIDVFPDFSYSYSALAVLVLVLEDTTSSTSTSTIKAKTAQL